MVFVLQNVEMVIQLGANNVMMETILNLMVVISVPFLVTRSALIVFKDYVYNVSLDT